MPARAGDKLIQRRVGVVLPIVLNISHADRLKQKRIRRLANNTFWAEVYGIKRPFILAHMSAK